MEIFKKDVEYIANLARLNFSDEEKENLMVRAWGDRFLGHQRFPVYGLHPRSTQHPLQDAC